MTIEMHLKLWTSVLIGGIYTFFVLACLILFGYYALKWVQVGMKLINRHFERKMRSGQIVKRLRKAKAAVVKVLSFDPQEKKKAVAKNGKEVK